tara:strand:- start:359 stop:676 length:318 start_codon:yes stop_codon:yes gene_type:complete
MTRADEIMLVAQVADNDSCLNTLSKLKDINGGTGSLVLNFDSSNNVAEVTLTTGADEFAALKALCRAFNNACRNTQKNVLVLADAAAATATVTIVDEITGCSSIA